MFFVQVQLIDDGKSYLTILLRLLISRILVKILLKTYSQQILKVVFSEFLQCNREDRFDRGVKELHCNANLRCVQSLRESKSQHQVSHLVRILCQDGLGVGG